MSLIGVFLGIVGIYLLVSQRAIVQQENSWLGIGLIFAAMLSWAYGSLFVGRADFPTNYFVNTGYQMVAGGIILALGSLVFGEEWISPLTWSPKVQVAMVLLILFGSIVAFSAFNFLLKTVSPEKVATNTYVNPIVAMILGWYILDEKISTQSIIAAIVLLTGVYFINTSKQRMGNNGLWRRG
ncbi:MAG: EamA family transporter [Bacteroidota bacterium]